MSVLPLYVLCLHDIGGRACLATMVLDGPVRADQGIYQCPFGHMEVIVDDDE